MSIFFQSSKRKFTPEKEDAEVKRQRKNEGRDLKEEGDEDESIAEERLKHLQELADKRTTESKDNTCSSTSSLLVQKGCLKSSWQQIGNLLLYTAAGVKGSDKVGPLLMPSNKFLVLLS